MINEMSLYVHIPFCEQKCNYCAFVSFCAKESVIEDYINLLCKEIEERKTNQKVKTIYIGGGTPSILNENQLERVVNCIYSNFDISEDVEFTIEANPNSLTEEKLKFYRTLKINRLSLGVQSLCDESLKKIGRLHTKEEAIEKVKLASKYFDNISCDLIVGLEGENDEALCEYAKNLLDLGVKHVSCYLLEVYENTKLGKMVKKGQYFPLDDQQTVEIYQKLTKFLENAGLVHYEISNFAYEGYESKHNLNYWKRGEYLGFGVSAHSFSGNIRTENAHTLASYKKKEVAREVLSPKEQIEETIMLSLRCFLGLDKKKVKSMGYDIEKNPYFSEYLERDILQEKNKRIYLNPDYYVLSNTIISNLLP